MKVKVVFCRDCVHCHLKDEANIDAGGWCCVDTPSHIAAVPARHYCSYGLEKAKKIPRPHDSGGGS